MFVAIASWAVGLVGEPGALIFETLELNVHILCVDLRCCDVNCIFHVSTWWRNRVASKERNKKGWCKKLYKILNYISRILWLAVWGFIAELHLGNSGVAIVYLGCISQDLPIFVSAKNNQKYGILGVPLHLRSLVALVNVRKS